MPAKVKSDKAVRKLCWDTFSMYIRLRDGYRTTGSAHEATCVTCGKIYPTTGVGCLQAGHFIPGRKGAYLYDEKQVNAQCYNCNMRLKGNWPPYYQFMVRRFGKEAVDHMINVQRNEVRSYKRYELEEMIEHYKLKIKELPNGIETSYQEEVLPGEGSVPFVPGSPGSLV